MENSRYTESASSALYEAQAAARTLGHSFVGSEHLLIGLIRAGGCVSATLKRYGVTYEAALPYVDTVIDSGRTRFTDSFGYTQSVKRILELSLYEAKSFGESLIDSNHILLSVLRERDCMGARIVDSLCSGVSELKDALIHGAAQQPTAENCTADTEIRTYLHIGNNGDECYVKSRSAAVRPANTPVLDGYSRSLTELAAQGGIDPVIGRDAEIGRLMQTLCRRNKNNPVLIGEPGVGKSAIVEGLALRLYEGDAPDALLGSRILSLDISAMLAGTRYRGEFEERLHTVVDELIAEPSTILFIDEIHTIVGAGAGEGSLDAANILKPALARGEFKVIGATTVDEYRSYIEKDAALERRFSPILVSEPTKKQTIEILKGLIGRYEAHHNVTFDEAAIHAAVELSVRYITDRRLPDKAIDLIDEAAARARLYGKKCQSGRITVSTDDVAQVVSDLTGVPNISASGAVITGLDELQKDIKVFGQDEALARVISALKMASAGFEYGGRPLCSLILTGRENVGRTTLANEIARLFFNSCIMRINGAEHSDEMALNRLMGVPVGYKDSEKGGTLSEYVRLHPFSVIYVRDADELSRDAQALFGRILSEGRAEDGRGRSINFRNCVIIMSLTVEKGKKLGFGTADDGSIAKAAYRRLMGDISERADAVIPFEELSLNALAMIAQNELKRLSERIAENGFDVVFDDTVVDRTVEIARYEPQRIRDAVWADIAYAVKMAQSEGTVQRRLPAVCEYQNGQFKFERKDR